MIQFFDFRKKIIASFKRAKADNLSTRNELGALKENMTEWVAFLEGERQEMRARIRRLEQRIGELEGEKIHR
ncbi:MAG: hypothetical protein ABIC95_03540 [archaeon]